MEERSKLEEFFEHLDEYIVAKIIDIVITVIITFIVIRMLEPVLTSNTLAAQAALQAMVKRL